MKSSIFGTARTAALALSGAVAAALAAPCALADDHGRWYIAPALNFVIADDDREADDDLGFQIGLGRELSERWNLELNLEADNLDFEAGGGSYKQRGASINGLYFFTREQGFSPYALIGVGALHNRLPGDKVTNVMGNAGLGFLANAGGDMSLRGEVRYRWDNDDETIASESGFGDWVVSVGVHIPFGRAAAPAAAPVAAPKPAPAPAPEPEPEPVVIAPVDSDGDGVADEDDACPGTPAGAEVDARGCEVDSDGDGVADNADLCPDTPAGAKVDVRGCEIREVITLTGVNFATSSARLLPESSSVLDETATTLLRYPDIRAEVGGHSDSTGSRAFNLELSRKRAESVRDYLISQGVPADRLTAAGYGPDRPIADNGTPEGRAANRRVELQIIE